MMTAHRPRDVTTAITQAEPFLRRLAREWNGVPMDFDDLLQHARIGVWRAWQTHDPARGNWHGHASRAARAEVINAIRVATAQKRHRNGQDRDLRFDQPGEDGYPLAETIPGAPDPADTLGSVTAQVAAWSRTRSTGQRGSGGRGHRGRVVTAPTVVEARVIIGGLIGVAPQELEAMTGVRAKAMDNARTRALGKLRDVIAA